MTAALLLFWIVTALLVQVAAAIAISTWRRGRTAANVPAAPLQAQQPAVGAWPGWRKFRVTRREFEDVAHTQCSFYLEPIDGVALPPFLPGQFLTFTLRVADTHAAQPGGERAVTRCYSLSEPPQPGRYRVTIKRVAASQGKPDAPPGVSSSHFHDQVREGDVLEVKAPAGRFFLDPDPNTPVVLIAGGIGITPLLSILGWCLGAQPGRDVHLYYGVRNSDVHAFKAQLDQWARQHPRFHLHVVYSRPGSNDVQGRDYQHAGHVDAALLRRTLPHGGHTFYACGPAPLMEDLVAALTAWGVPQHDIHHEAFGPASVRVARPEPALPGRDATLAFEVRFDTSGRTLEWNARDESLLDFAERHGVSVASGCRSGGCGTCETRLLAGSVHYATPPDHDVATGHCLLCVGTPAGALVLAA